MTIRELINNDGTWEIIERELTPEEESEMYPEPEPEPAEVDPLEAVDAMLVDHEYRLTLMELGINEMEV